MPDELKTTIENCVSYVADRRRLEAAQRLIDMLTYNGSERGYTRGSRIWGNELYEAATAWTFISGEEVDLSWVNIDE